MHINNIIAKAKRVFGDIKTEYETMIDEQRVNHEKQEQSQKFVVEQRRIERYESIQTNMQNTSVSIAEIDLKFGHYEQLEESAELREAVDRYRKDIEQVLTDKNNLIARMKEDLQAAEEQYILGISRFHNGFESTVLAGKKHFETCRSKALEQLIEVESELLGERTKVLKRNQKELKAIFDAHEKSETEFMKYRESEEERNLKELTQIRQERNREYSELKLLLEVEIQNHEKCLEDMKAIYQLNQEKLTYNFKVLTEKKEENTALTVVLKKKERFFFNLLKKKNDDFYLKDIEFRKNNNRLTEQSKTITKQYRELHKKFEHFEKADVEKYEQIKEISLKSIDSLKAKIISCNRVIMNQQLGFQADSLIGHQDPFGSLNGDENRVENNVPSVKNVDESVRNSVRSSKIRVSMGSENDVSRVTDDNANLKNVNNSFSDEEKHRVVQLILKHTEFLLDDKIISEIEGLPSDNDKMLRRLDLLMKIFSIRTLSEANDWLFKLHMQCLMFEEERYDEDLIVVSISKLLESRKKTDAPLAPANFADALDANKKYSKKENKELAFWKSASAVLNKEVLDIWHILDKRLAKYYGLLKQRKETLVKSNALKKENQELKRLLDQYLQQEVMLIYPPKIEVEKVV